ncbi:DUF3429 domain-containing protein [Massilia sp. W12]|uniref:DUF3429 domain-containing protein n=1 Tax=Massilia sp. W12 TaxID=3126507 RepID=UPI0030CAC3BE
MSKATLFRCSGLAVLLPYFLLSIACFLAHKDWISILVERQLRLGCVMLGLAGGVHLACLALREDLSPPQQWRSLAWGLGPALLALGAMSIDNGLSFVVQLLAALAGFRIDSRFYASYGLPEWCVQARNRFMYYIIVAQALTFIAVNWRT